MRDAVFLGPAVDRRYLLFEDALFLGSECFGLAAQIGQAVERTLGDRGAGIVDRVEQVAQLAGQHGFPGVFVFVGLVQGLDHPVVPGLDGRYCRRAGFDEPLPVGMLLNQGRDL